MMKCSSNTTTGEATRRQSNNFKSRSTAMWHRAVMWHDTNFTLKMEAARCSETFLSYDNTTRCHNPESSSQSVTYI